MRALAVKSVCAHAFWRRAAKGRDGVTRHDKQEYSLSHCDFHFEKVKQRLILPGLAP